MSSKINQRDTLVSTSVKDITVTCADSTPLAASLFTPHSPAKAAVMIGPATGIKRQFYSAFATYLSEQGFGVITLDNRGIGGSVKSSVKQSDASLVTWGEQDMPAVLETLKIHFPNVPYFLLVIVQVVSCWV